MLKKQEQGQVIVIMVFGIIAMAVVVGLAIDSGRLYAQRRQTQNAVDAAAMAGALKLADVIVECRVGDYEADQNVRAAIVDIARHNGLELGSPNAKIEAFYANAGGDFLGWVGAGSIPNTATAIRMTGVTSDTTTFLRLAGQDEFATAAGATSMVGVVRSLTPSESGQGVLPIAVPLEVVLELDPGEHWYVMENNKHHGGAFCLDENAGQCIGDPSAHNAHRGWLNFNFIYNVDHRTASDPLNRSFERNASNKGCGGDPNKSVDDGLKGWAGDDCPYPFPIFAGDIDMTNGDFIHGDPGARQSSLMEVINSYNHQTVYVPIFDYIYMSDYMDEHFTAPQEPADGNLGGNHWPRAGGGGHAFLYHIVGFVAVIIDDNNLHDHVLEGEFVEAIWGNLGDLESTDGVGGTCERQLVGITLFE